MATSGMSTPPQRPSLARRKRPSDLDLDLVLRSKASSRSLPAAARRTNSSGAVTGEGQAASPPEVVVPSRGSPRQGIVPPKPPRSPQRSSLLRPASPTTGGTSFSFLAPPEPPSPLPSPLTPISPSTLNSFPSPPLGRRSLLSVTSSPIDGVDTTPSNTPTLPVVEKIIREVSPVASRQLPSVSFRNPSPRPVHKRVRKISAASRMPRRRILATSNSSMDSYNLSDDGGAGSPAPRSEESSRISTPSASDAEGEEFDVGAYAYSTSEGESRRSAVAAVVDLAPPPRSSMSLPTASPTLNRAPSIPRHFGELRKDPEALKNMSREEKEAKVREMREGHRQKREKERQGDERQVVRKKSSSLFRREKGKDKEQARPLPPPLPLEDSKPTGKLYSLRRLRNRSANTSAASFGTANPSLSSFLCAKEGTEERQRARTRSRSSSIDSTASKKSFFSVRSGFSMRSSKKYRKPVPDFPGDLAAPATPPSAMFLDDGFATSRRIPPPSPVSPVSLASSSWASPIFDHDGIHRRTGSGGSVTPATTPEMTFDERGRGTTDDDDEEREAKEVLDLSSEDEEQWEDAEEDRPLARINSFASFATALSIPPASTVPPLPASFSRRTELDEAIGQIWKHRRTDSGGRVSIISNASRRSATVKGKRQKRISTASKREDESDGEGAEFEDAEEEPEWMGVDETSFNDLDRAVALSKEARRMSAQVSLSGADSRKRYSLLSGLSADRSRAWHARQSSSSIGRARADSPISARTPAASSLRSAESSDASESGRLSPLVGSASRPLSDGKSVPLFTRHASIRHSRGPSISRIGASRRTASVSAASTLSTGSAAAVDGASFKPRPMLLLRGASLSIPSSPNLSLGTLKEPIAESPEAVEAALPVADGPPARAAAPPGLDLSLMPRNAGVIASPEASPVTQDFNLQASLASLDNSLQELAMVSPPRSRRPSVADSVSPGDLTLTAAPRHLPSLDGIPESDTFTSLPSLSSPRRTPRSRSASTSATTSPTSLSFDAQEAATLLASATTTRRVRADSVAKRRNGSISTLASPTVPEVEVLAEVKPAQPVLQEPFIETRPPATPSSPATSFTAVNSRTSEASLRASSSPLASPRTTSPMSTWTDDSTHRKNCFKFKSLFKSRPSATSPVPSVVALPARSPSRRDGSAEATESGRSTDELSHRAFAPVEFARGDLSSFGKIFSGDDGFEYIAESDSAKASSQTGLDVLVTAQASPKSRQSRLINVQRDVDGLDKPHFRSIRGRSVAIGGPVRMSTQEESLALWKMIGGRSKSKR